MSDLEANKQLVRQFLSAFSKGDVDGMVTLMTEDSSWWVSGCIEGLSGTYPRNQFAELVKGAKAAYKTGALQITPTSMVAEGDRVAAEAESFAETVSGEVYNNFYHLLFTIRDGKIAAVKEYMDTLHAKQVFIDGA
jgi:uncharacterized protein